MILRQMKIYLSRKINCEPNLLYEFYIELKNKIQKLLEEQTQNQSVPSKNISLKKCFDLIENIKTILKNAIKDAILDGIIANEKKEAYQFLIKKAEEIGLKPKR